MSEYPLTKSYVRRIDRKNPIRDVTPYQLWDEARKNGFVGSVLNLETEERMTNTKILALADKFAKGMLALGFKSGEGSIAVIGCPSLYAGVGMYVASNSIGVAFAHPTVFHPYETSIENTLTLADCSLVVVGEGNNSQAYSALMNIINYSNNSKLPCVEHLYYYDSYKSRSKTEPSLKYLDRLIEVGETITDKQLEEAKRLVDPSDIMLHCYSSGSTGRPKCIAHSFKGAANAMLQLRPMRLPCILGMNINGDETDGIAVVSMMLAGKFKNSVMAPDVGTTRTAAEFAKLCLDAIFSERVEILGVAAAISQGIAQYCEEQKIKPPSMRLTVFGAQIMTRGYKEKLLSVFKGIAWTLYGMTEIGPSHWTSLKNGPLSDEARLNAMLKTSPNAETRIVNEQGDVVDIGIDGEVQYKGSYLLKSYPKNDEIFKKLITDDGFARTGDIGFMDSKGRIFIKGRMADAMRFKVFSKVVYPAPIEETLGSHKSIKDISVISGKHSNWIGDEITYCISLVDKADRLDEDDLIAYGKSRGLTDQHRPCRIIYFDELLRTTNGRKVSKHRLREEVEKRIAQDPLVGVTKAFRGLAQKYGGRIEERQFR